VNDEPRDRPLADALLWGLPVAAIERMLTAADGNEIGSGKVFSAQSSAALSVNTFGVFLDRPDRLAPLPGTEDLGWPATSVRIEAQLPFPWRGGRRPNMDVLVETPTALIGIESKRYEPFDTHAAPGWSETYWSLDWGPRLARYAALRDASRAGTTGFRHLEEAQLVKHALGLWTAVAQGRPGSGKSACLVHLRAEPSTDRAGRPLGAERLAVLGAEVEGFGAAVAGDGVRFVGLTYRALLETWMAGTTPQLRGHAAALRAFFGDGI
jgi:hypothetical protein